MNRSVSASDAARSAVMSTLSQMSSAVSSAAICNTGGVPTRIRLADYPQLERLAWQFQGASEVTPAEALNLYERNWRHIEQGMLAPHERGLIQQLVASLGGSRLLV